MTHSTHPSQPFDLDRIVDRLLDPLPTSPGPLRAHRFGHDHETDDDHDDAEADVLAQFREQAEAIHEQVVHDHDVFVVEFLGATGSGKTSLIERLIERAGDERIGVIVGDVAGDDDATRFRELGVEVANVNTGKECHLDPSLVEDALAEFDLDALDTLFVENVGNMVCPADFPLGAQLRVLVVSTTEGDDVIRKHPLLVQAVDAAVINKIDVAAALDADVDRMAADVADVAPDLPVFRTSAKAQIGLDDLADAMAAVEAAGHAHSHDHSTGDHAHSHDSGGDHGAGGHATGQAHVHEDDPLAPWRGK